MIPACRTNAKITVRFPQLRPNMKARGNALPALRLPLAINFRARGARTCNTRRYGSTAAIFFTATPFEFAEHPLLVCVPATRRLTICNKALYVPAPLPDAMLKLIDSAVSRLKFENVNVDAV